MVNMAEEDPPLKLPPATDFTDFVKSRKIPSHPVPPLPPPFDALSDNAPDLLTLPILKELSTHPKSGSLPENSYTKLTKPYVDILPEYSRSRDQIESYNQAHPGQNKIDFLDPNNPNLGWKFHLNVQPGQVLKVSQYLTGNGYYHKFLTGGELEDGKVFTVYIGSKKKIDQLAAQVSQDLQPFLSKPTDHREIEFAPGVVGRFVAKDNSEEFHAYGTHGLVFLKKYFDKSIEIIMQKGSATAVPASLTEEAISESFRRLKEKYGTYFTG